MSVHPKLVVEIVGLVIVQSVAVHEPGNGAVHDRCQGLSQLDKGVPPHKEKLKQVLFLCSEADVLHPIQARLSAAVTANIL